jgi:hypothetical protein
LIYKVNWHSLTRLQESQMPNPKKVTILLCRTASEEFAKRYGSVFLRDVVLNTASVDILSESEHSRRCLVVWASNKSVEALRQELGELCVIMEHYPGYPGELGGRVARVGAHPG